MADPQDRALGAAIRRRREALGLQQRQIAAQAGLASVVYGRIELGNRPVRATELRDIARILGVDMESLVREVSPVTAEELVQRAVVQRDAAAAALRDYGSAFAEAAAAVIKDGAFIEGSNDLETPSDLAEYLWDTQDHYVPLRAPADVAPVLQQVLARVHASLVTLSSVGDEDG
ncbi:anaerobic benzoate catabolism transcriptional regulator [Mycobacteroides abscessus subsp. massiliense]|uniref:helix-turn-helix domain-containing protein n=1 Tax=Mycobacteroides TaxID=670516 RepID=UPI000928D74F|nr:MULTISPECIES: helix-turn-helix transcriptional regulator [Mycobacteroides]MBV0918044.1 helix-turn-helix domain-containing protein [Mycobacteroides chelonae]RIT59376.1 XRE family transcriptional regulator [Mycobacteroides abscessus]RIU52513.1 XRE family transcriptional regulator [Mycobacteroides abscessus]SHX53994.1 anaerobic benzoate catabolism transcriptional regulator [Mycobacteroides abscessus subsp. abscessus]SKM76188.1 anaerobic benzoate catabolism transcriptional regulator [Mycobacter